MLQIILSIFMAVVWVIGNVRYAEYELFANVIV